MMVASSVLLVFVWHLILTPLSPHICEARVLGLYWNLLHTAHNLSPWGPAFIACWACGCFSNITSLHARISAVNRMSNNSNKIIFWFIVNLASLFRTILAREYLSALRQGILRYAKIPFSHGKIMAVFRKLISWLCPLPLRYAWFVAEIIIGKNDILTHTVFDWVGFFW